MSPWVADVLTAAEALTMHQKYANETDDEFFVRMTRRRSYTSFNIDLYDAVVRWRKQRGSHV